MIKLALLNLEGTLVHSASTHAQAFVDAIGEVHGIDVFLDWENVQGMTDRGVLKLLLNQAGVKDYRLKDCMDAMAVHYRKSLKSTDIKILDGAEELLNELKRTGYGLVLVTGNLKEIADAKLEQAGLKSYFEVGAYGSDSEFKIELIRIALHRANSNLHYGGNDKGAILFGDTPSDMQSARMLGLRAIGVATGVHRVNQLKTAGADVVVRSLSEVDKIVKVLT